MAKEEPVVIKKIIKKGHGHHGGAWKLAYADFVTAMMAFFLLMWLLSVTDEKTRRGIAEYFQDPYKATLVNKGEITSLEETDPKELEAQAEKKDLMQLEVLKDKIQQKIDADPKLKDVKEQIKLDITKEGLRIQVIDNNNKKPMFKLGSSVTEPEMRLILKELAPMINPLPNRLTINGHTDAKHYAGGPAGYTNWELSSERANAARIELIKGGMVDEKFMRVIGLASSLPYNPEDTSDPMNRRISIIVMNKKTEKEVMQGEDRKPGTAPPNPAATPAAHGGKPGETPAATGAAAKPAEAASATTPPAAPTPAAKPAEAANPATAPAAPAPAPKAEATPASPASAPAAPAASAEPAPKPAEAASPATPAADAKPAEALTTPAAAPAAPVAAVEAPAKSAAEAHNPPAADPPPAPAAAPAAH